MPIQYIPRKAAKPELMLAVFEAVKETFELDIKPEAVKNSPVTPAGLAINLAMGKKGVLAKGTGHNRQSIDVEVEESGKGAVAKLFTQSGYGGWLELGTSKMRAQPYLMPAFQKFIRLIPKRIKERLK